MGVFDSSANTSTTQTTDNRATQAGNDVSQTNVSLTKSKKNTINITNTDYGAMAKAGELMKYTTGQMTQVSESAMRNNRQVTQDVIGLVDTTGRRNNDLARDVIGSSSAVSEAALGVVDSSNRRAFDGMNKSMDVVDSSNRRAIDGMKSVADKAFGTFDSVSRRASDTANKAIDEVAASAGLAVSLADTTNRRFSDGMLLGQKQSYGFAEGVIAQTFGALDTKDRRQTDMAIRAIESSENSAAVALSETRKSTEQQVNAIKDFAKSVTVGNEEGTNRLLLALILVAGIVAIAAVVFIT